MTGHKRCRGWRSFSTPGCLRQRPPKPEHHLSRLWVRDAKVLGLPFWLSQREAPSALRHIGHVVHRGPVGDLLAPIFGYGDRLQICQIPKGRNIYYITDCEIQILQIGEIAQSRQIHKRWNNRVIFKISSLNGEGLQIGQRSQGGKINRLTFVSIHGKK